ncbi:MAG: Ferrochelatase [Legionellaceae bacterium]
MIGVLLLNLGTPDAPTTKAVRKYLREFLSDPRVIKIPKPIWNIILYGFILPFRPSRSAKLYQKIWQEEGSALKVLSLALTEKIQDLLNEQAPEQYRVSLGMRYGNPSIASALEKLNLPEIKKLIILPLYPQFSATTTASAFDGIAQELKKSNWLPEIHFYNQYVEHASYIKAIANSISNYWDKNGRGEKLVFSFHGIPKQFVNDGDPYQSYCQTTAKRIAQELNLTSTDWLAVFQSRFGKAEWLTPYCDKTLEELGQKGYKNLDIICPGFAVDCLETLEEICVENEELFIKAGGKSLNYIPALNASLEHAQCLVELFMKK